MSDEKQEIVIPEKLHKFGMAGGELDEVFIKDAHVHIERMGDTAFWIGIHAAGMAPIMLNTGVCRGVWYFKVEEDSLDHKARMLRIQRPRKSKPIPNPEIIELRTKLTAADSRARSAEADLAKSKQAFEDLRIADQATLTETLAAALEQSLRAEKAEAERDAAIELAAWKPITPETKFDIGKWYVIAGLDPLGGRWYETLEGSQYQRKNAARHLISIKRTHYRSINAPSIVADGEKP